MSSEIKATTLGLNGGFHLTANEWNRAVSGDLHAFHLWDFGEDVATLAVVSANDVAPHVPANQGDGAWESVEIPYRAFVDAFLIRKGRLSPD